MFDRKFLVRRHILEQHSGFAYMCSGCELIFPRRDNHSSCNGKFGDSRKMMIIRRSDGLGGRAAEEAFMMYNRNIDTFITVVPVDNRSHCRTVSQPVVRAPSPVREISLHPEVRITPSPKRRRVSASPEPLRTRSRTLSSSSSSSCSSK